jgi:hypothetical protein
MVNVWVLPLLAVPVLAFGESIEEDIAPFFKRTDAATSDDWALPVIKPVDPRAPFPQLPTVQAMTNTSDHTAHAIFQEVNKIQSRVHDLMRRDQDVLAKKKAEFEAELQSEEQETRDVISTNVKIATRITALQKGNQVLRQKAKELQAENKAVQTELRSASTKVSSAGNFIGQSLKATDDRKAKVLAVLTKARSVGHVQKANIFDNEEDTASQEKDMTVESDENSNQREEETIVKHKSLRGVFSRRNNKADGGSSQKDDDGDGEDDADADDVDDNDDQETGESFLMMSRRARRENAEEGTEADSDSETNDESDQAPESHTRGLHGHKVPPVYEDSASKALLESASKELKALAMEDAQSLQHEAELFKGASAQEHRSVSAALAQQLSLNKTEVSLLSVQSKLRRAVSHLQVTRDHLRQRVQGLGQYLQHLSHLLLAPSQEAGALVQDMPEDVPIPEIPMETTTTAVPALVQKSGPLVKLG